jgi:hypothetical protein
MGSKWRRGYVIFGQMYLKFSNDVEFKLAKLLQLFGTI